MNEALAQARIAAWNIYIARLNESVQAQRAEFDRGEQVTRLTMMPPTKEQVAILERVYHNARLEGRQSVLHAALDQVIKATDAIDNTKGGKKVPAIRELYDTLTEVYDALHALKLELAQDAGAVDPHAGTTTT